MPARDEESESKTQVYYKLLKAEQLYKEFQGFRQRLIAGSKGLGWGDFYDKLSWLNDYMKQTGWMRVLDLCRHNDKKVIKGVVADMRPWKNPHIWEPFVRDLLAGLGAWFENQKDMVSLLAYLTGPAQMPPQKAISAMKLHYESLAKIERKKR